MSCIVQNNKASIPEVDALTGKAIGRPKTGTYALTDLVGLDIAVSVIRGLQQDPDEAPFSKMRNCQINCLKQAL